MFKSTPLVVALLLGEIAACSQPTTTTQQPSRAFNPTLDQPSNSAPASHCEHEPKFVPGPVIAEGQPFDVTGERVEKGAEHRFGMGDDIIFSTTEGGSRFIRVHALNECGLWLAELYVGSVIGGDADTRKTTYSLLRKKPRETGYTVELLGVDITIVAHKDGSFVATLNQTIKAYEGK